MHFFIFITNNSKNKICFGGSMQKTGILRKVDDLGRIVIPKEIRKNLKIREGEELEISIQNENQVVLQKSEPFNSSINVYISYVRALAKVSNATCILTDMEKVICAFGSSANLYINKNLTQKYIEKLSSRIISIRENKIINICEFEDISKISDEKILPILIDGTLIGSVIMLTNNFTKKIGNVEEKLLEQASEFFKAQMEI